MGYIGSLTGCNAPYLSEQCGYMICTDGQPDPTSYTFVDEDTNSGLIDLMSNQVLKIWLKGNTGGNVTVRLNLTEDARWKAGTTQEPIMYVPSNFAITPEFGAAMNWGGNYLEYSNNTSAHKIFTINWLMLLGTATYETTYADYIKLNGSAINATTPARLVFLGGKLTVDAHSQTDARFAKDGGRVRVYKKETQGTNVSKGYIDENTAVDGKRWAPGSPPAENIEVVFSTDPFA